MSNKATVFTAAVSVFAMAFPAVAQEMGDAVAGEKVFVKCKACHVVEEAKNRVGPTLNGVIGRTPGTVEDYKYSKAMKEFGQDHTWDEATLTEYLAAPRDMVKGTKMTFPGLKDDADIANVIAYLKQFSS
jgi:cytochrome c